jgi:hypothetical protein
MRCLASLHLGALIVAVQTLANPTAAQENSGSIVSITLPKAASTSPAAAQTQLDMLADYAYNIATASLGKSNSKLVNRGGCTLDSLQIRKEWYKCSHYFRLSFIFITTSSLT